jgi:hypothetical protein
MPKPPIATARTSTRRLRLAAGLGLAALAIVAPARALASELSAEARKEVDHLLHIVGTSRCEFYRAGTWHSAAVAQAHLEHKYQYLATRQMLSSAEDFIVKAATRSSLTGEPYAIRCPQMPAKPSAVWLESELLALRNRKPPGLSGR